MSAAGVGVTGTGLGGGARGPAPPLGDAYVLERELGGGGMSRVFLAEEVALGRRVVVKVLPPGLGDAVSVERFRREVRLVARLQHPRIVPLLAAGALPDGVLFYTMPFVEGETLARRGRRHGGDHGSAAPDARFVAPGWLFLVGSESGPLYAQRFDPSRLQVSGIPLRVLDRVASGRGSASYSAAGDVLVSLDPTLPVVAPRVVWVDRQGAVVDSAVAPDSVRRMAVSHDGRRLALWGPGLWLYDRDRRVATRAHALAGPGQLVVDAAWGPGDTTIAYGTARAGAPALRLYHAATDASDSLFAAAGRFVGAPDWSPDGRRIAFTLGSGPGAPTQEVWVYARDTRRAVRAWATEGAPLANLGTPRWSPDGRWLAYTSDETGATEVYVRPVAGSGAAVRVSPAGGAPGFTLLLDWAAGLGPP